MRFVILLTSLLVVAACSQPPTENSDQTAPSAVSGTAYALSEMEVIDSATVSALEDGSARIVTNVGSGAFSAYLDLAEDDSPTPGATVRVVVQAEQGSANLLSTHRDFERGYAHYVVKVLEGEPQILDLPVDQNGDPVLIIANGRNDGQTSTIRLISVVPAAPN